MGKWVRWCIADSWNETREDMEVLNEWLLAEHLNITYHRPLLRYLNSRERRDNGIPDFWELPSIHRNPRSFAARKGFPMSCKRCIVPKVNYVVQVSFSFTTYENINFSGNHTMFKCLKLKMVLYLRVRFLIYT